MLKEEEVEEDINRAQERKIFDPQLFKTLKILKKFNQNENP